MVPFAKFIKSCERRLDAPLTRFWGSRPHPDLSMIADNALWAPDDPNIDILPQWHHPPNATHTMPFVDTHIAVRFLGGVSNFSLATSPNCKDIVGPKQAAGVDRPGVWCDLVVRDPKTNALHNRFDLVRSRLDMYVNNGIDVMIVLDDVPWAFVNQTSEICQGFGCQYLPPDNPQEFANWVGELAEYLVKAYGTRYSSRIRWRLGTEANGPRWGGRGKYFDQYLDSYIRTMKKLREVIPTAKVGASNWVEVEGKSGNLSKNGSDAFQYKFYSAIAKDPTIPLDWISVSHYGGASSDHTHDNFPGADFVDRTPNGRTGKVEVLEMRRLAQRPHASIEVQEWSILKNEVGGASYEPSSVGTAWMASSATSWMCHGADRLFHWESGTTLRNASGNNRVVNFYEQMAWNMAFLELFVGGKARFVTYDLPPSNLPTPTTRSALSEQAVPSQPNRQRDTENDSTGKKAGPLNSTVTLIESVKDAAYFLLVSALASNRSNPFHTTVTVKAEAPFFALGANVVVQQYRMNSSRSVVETVVRELRGKPGLLLHDDGLPYDFGRLLTPAGFAYAQSPANLERFWHMHASTFKPELFEGKASLGAGGTCTFEVPVTAASVTVLVARSA
jgi:hypothetical protein